MKLQSQKYAFIGCESSFEQCKTVVFGAPFDGTSSYRAGSRFAPQAIRNEGYSIETYSPYLDLDLTQKSIFDAGDLLLPFGNTQSALDSIEEISNKILSKGKKQVMLGGEHLVTLGAFKAAQKLYPNLCFVCFDAHTDLRDDYLGDKLSHACVTRRIWELTGDGSIFLFGVRSGEKAEFEWGQEHLFLQKHNFENLDSALALLAGKPVYFSIDLDVLDPSELPGTGTPEAGGVRFLELLDAVQKVMKLNVVALDICELSPNYDLSGASVSLTCKLLRELLLQI